MLKIAICDDDPDSLRSYARRINDTAVGMGLDFVLLTFSTAQELLLIWDDGPSDIDILFLDIILGKVNGVQLAKKLRNNGSVTQIIFLTGSEEYMAEAFDVNPVHYLVKGKTDDEKLSRVFGTAINLVNKKREEIFACEYKGEQYFIPIDEICYVEIWNRIISVHSGGKEVKFYSRLEELEKKLGNKNFVRIHRSFLVNLSYVSGVKRDTVLLKNGESLPLGKTYTAHFKKTLSEYICNTNIYFEDEKFGGQE